MINWNDIRVEQEIAQERYQDIIRARQLARLDAGHKNKVSLSTEVRNRLGDQLMNWGCSLKAHCELA